MTTREHEIIEQFLSRYTALSESALSEAAIELVLELGLTTEWAVRYEDKATVDMSGKIRYSYFTMPSREGANRALVLLHQRNHPDAVIVHRRAGEWVLA